MPKALASNWNGSGMILESAFQGRAGFRIHHPGRQGFHAPNPQRQTHRRWRQFGSPCDMVKEKLIDWKTAIMRVPADQLDQVLAPVFDREAVKNAKAIARGLPAGPGAATGKIYFNADRAVAAADKGEKVLLVRGRNFAGRFARHDRGRRHSDRAWRCQFTRGAGRAANGQSLHLRRQRRCTSITARKRCRSTAPSFSEGDDYLSIDGTSGTVYAGRARRRAVGNHPGCSHGDKTRAESRDISQCSIN